MHTFGMQTEDSLGDIKELREILDCLTKVTLVFGFSYNRIKEK